jgi:hypothetical protein
MTISPLLAEFRYYFLSSPSLDPVLIGCIVDILLAASVTNSMPTAMKSVNPFLTHNVLTLVNLPSRSSRDLTHQNHR